jgi:GLPGLI family protein
MGRLTINLFCLALCLLGAVSATAQQGVVTYEEVTKMTINLPPEMEHMRAEIPDSQTSTKRLVFNESASLLKDMPAEDEQETDIHAGHGGAMIRFDQQRAEDETYFDFDEDRRVEKRAFMGRTFLITGDLSELPWRLTDERSEFLGYLSQKAVAENDSTVFEAWFTPEISVPTGPGYGGLPGLILVLNIDDGQRSYVAKEISLETIEADAITPPDKGKKVSQAEFDEIVAEKMKEMGGSSSGNGTFVIRMQH